jgi:hypothetical protein
MSRETQYTNYNRLLEQAREAGASTARTWIPKLCQALREEDKNLSKEDIRDRVEKDCAYIWSKSTIRTYIPGEFKDLQKQEAGRKGREKQLEETIPAVGVPETGTENSSVPSKVLESESFEDTDRGPDVKPASQIINKLQNELKSVRTKLEAQLEEEKRKVALLQEQQDVSDIPQLIDNKIGPLKVQNLSKINEYDRRGYQILSSRFGEIVRRKIVAEGKATIRFYIIGKDRTTNIEYLAPIAFTVDMMGRTTELILDESRL